MNEIWKPITGYEGLYEVSNTGKVKSLPKYLGPRYRGEIILKPAYNRYGYLIIVLCKESICKTRTVHRLVLETFIGLHIKEKVCNHKNGIKSDNRLINLEWVTIAENTQHGFTQLGRKPICGEKHKSSKLTNKDIFEIRNLLQQKLSQCKIANLYDVCQYTISDIKTRKTWKHI